MTQAANLRSLRPTNSGLRGRVDALELERPDVLDTSRGFLGMGRSDDFPFIEWRDRDPYRTVFFDEGQGRTLVFVHGLGANATHWQFVAQRLVGRHRVVGLDLVGCGWSRKPDRRYTIELLRDHLLDFLDRRGIQRADLIGHSLGGAVCLAAAFARPAMFDSLTLICAAGVAPLPRWMRIAAPLFVRRWMLLPTLTLGANFIVNNIFVEGDEANGHVAWFRRTALRDAEGNPNLHDFVRVCESLCPDVAGRDFSSQLPTLRPPVLAVWGEDDKLTAVPAVIRSLGRIPRVRTVMMARTGHMPMIERPEQTAFHLQRFLRDPP